MEKDLKDLKDLDLKDSDLEKLFDMSKKYMLPDVSLPKSSSPLSQAKTGSSKSLEKQNNKKPTVKELDQKVTSLSKRLTNVETANNSSSKRSSKLDYAYLFLTGADIVVSSILISLLKKKK